jgi:hypothetical protein
VKHKFIPRNKLVKKLDKLWSMVIHKKFNNKCVVCGAVGILHSHHCIVNKGRGGYGVRWLILNGVLLCPGCHLFKIHHGQADKAWLDNYLMMLNVIIPNAEQQNIIDISHRITKYSIPDLEGIEVELEKLLEGNNGN